MNHNQDPRTPPQDSAVSSYTALYLAGLGGIVVVLIQQGFGLWSLIPGFAGVLGLVTRWGSAPVLLLLVLTAELSVPGRAGWRWSGRWMPAGPVHLVDWVLCMAVLASVIAHYRLQSLTSHVFPLDPRRRQGPFRWEIGFFMLRRRARIVHQRRAARLVSQREIGILVLVLPLWAGLAEICWRFLPRQWANPGMPPRWWQAILLAWLAALCVWVTAGLIGYWSRQRMTSEEATLFLQDTLWRETHREQRKINRWLAWARLRRPKGDPEKPTS